jgi:hypothetical protein
MNRFRALAAGLLLCVAPVASGPAQAMEIRQFDKMAGADQDQFIADLIEGAEKVLTDEHRPDLSAKVSRLFTTRLGNDQISVGMGEFQRNLARARLADVQNVAKNPNAQRIEVEDALGVTLQKNGIELPDSFFTVLRNFRPKYPPQKQ